MTFAGGAFGTILANAKRAPKLVGTILARTLARGQGGVGSILARGPSVC